MCGIAGLYPLDSQRRPTEKDVASMLDLMAHRGPDDRALCNLKKGRWLAHVRLSILDLSEKGRQPMKRGSTWIVYNGEVYSFREMRAELEKAGHSFFSDTDTEVLLAGAEEWGLGETLRRSNGMFALALVDEDSTRLRLARDRFGIKPLYYRVREGVVEFASELKAFGPAGDPPAWKVLSMLSGAPNLAPDTPWEGVYEVEPGEIVEFRQGKTEPAKSHFASLDEMVSESRWRENEDADFDDLAEELARLFRQAVERSTLSDAPVGIGLSGGLDSAAILAVLSRGEKSFPCFHADVRGHESERPFAEQATSELGASLAVATMKPSDFVSQMASATWSGDYPLGFHPNAVPFSMMSRRASQDVKVLLTGEGADEFFGGYGWIRDNWLRKKSGSVKGRLGSLAHRLGARSANWWRVISGSAEQGVMDDYARLRELWSGGRGERETARAAEAYGFLPEGGEERHYAEGFFVTALGHLQSLLWRNDRMGMLAGIESRFPFLDLDLVEFALHLPAKYRGGARESKPLLRKAARRVGLGDQLASREKFAFSANPSHFAKVDPQFFAGGFLEDYLPGIAASKQGADWDNFYFYLLATEVWGRVFCRGEKAEEITKAMAGKA